MTDRRPGGELLLFAGEILLGRSELEYEDAGTDVWLRSGSFFPAKSYFQFQDLFQKHGDELVASRLATCENNREALAQLAAQIDALHLRLVHPSGAEIPVAAFELQDCADTLGEDPRELQVEIRDPAVHEKYFSQPIDG